MTTIETIRAEIERRIKELQRIISEHIGEDCLFTKGSIDAYNGLLSFLSTLESEKPMLKEAVETELYWDGDFLAIDLNMAELGYSERDKVRIIIVKEDEK